MLAPNTLLQDRYLVARLLGQGGMGAVYQATDRKFGNAVALKETFYNDSQLRKAFSHEARLLNRLRHAALPVVMDYFAIGERQFLVMQYIPGKDLEQLLNEKKSQGQEVFPASQVLRWADQLLDALEYLHSQNPPIIHRDIKPQNLKLTPRGEIILLDFGLAKGVVTHQSRASQSIRGYTPNYASLEQIRGTGTDARSDIYSMGATIYHLLTGEMPQDAMSRIAAILMGQPDPLKPVAALNPGVSATIAAVIEKAMSPHPDQRYTSAATMRQALRSAANETPPVNLHRARTLTDQPLKAEAAAAETRMRKMHTALPPPPPMKMENTALPSPVKVENTVLPPPPSVAKPADSPTPDHLIILLDDVNRKTPKRNIRQRNIREAAIQENVIREDVIREADDQVAEVQEKDIREASVQEKDFQDGDIQKKDAQEIDIQEIDAHEIDVNEQPAQTLILEQPTILTGPLQRKRALLYGLGAYILATLLICVIVYKAFEKRPDLLQGAAELVSTTQVNVGGPVLAIPMRVEALRYYLEIASSSNKAGDKAARVSGLMPLEGGTKFKFHFKPAEGGYLYIIALGRNGGPQTFLTAQPMPASGVTTNWSNAGTDFHFPDGGQWFMIQKDAENTPFTVIFSKKPLTTPAFLSLQSGRDLSADERQELMDMRKRYAASAPELVAIQDGSQPAVAVQSPAERAANEPVIFDISIKRK
ncbi:MAG: Serine/threonine-protein kinase PknD [Acidobacteria bacterium]|nr:Serine/threonine-protein kinase PknD [Acidobacteriota bacterium]